MRSFSGDLSDNPSLRLRLDAAGRISDIPERQEFIGISGYHIGIHRISIEDFSQLKFAKGYELCVNPARLRVLRATLRAITRTQIYDLSALSAGNLGEVAEINVHCRISVSVSNIII